MMRTFLKIISYIFQPLLMPLYGMILLMQTNLFSFFAPTYKIIALAGTLLFTGLLPALPIYMMMKRGQIKDLFISKREERTMPYLFSMLSYLFWLFFLWRTLQFPPEFALVAAGSVLSVFLMVFINLKWKISAHLAGMGGFVGGVFAYSYLMAVNPIGLIVISIIISGLVAVSRVYLKAHTLSQTLAGFCLGFLCVFLPGVIYQLI